MSATKSASTIVSSSLAAIFATLAAGECVAASAPGSGDSVTFYKDMLPIFQESCQVCHRPGQIAPFSMLDYEETRPYARAIKRLVQRREMPPWFADPSIGHFSNDPSLSNEKIDLIAKWVDGGAVAGRPADAPMPVKWPEGGWVIPPDHVAKGGEIHVPKDGVVDWLYVVMPSGFKEDTWVTSMEMRPGVDPSVTHHYCVYIVPKIQGVKYNQLGITAEDLGVNRGMGFDGCYEPGQGPFDYRAYNAGRLIPANSDIVYQMHYVPKGKKELVDQPQIGFTVAKTRPAKQFFFQNVGAGVMLDIPPNDPNYKAPTQEGELTLDAEIVWLQGHAHYRAKEMLFSIGSADGRFEPVLKVNWDPNWQQVYYPAKPIAAPKGTVVRVEGWYDNSKRNYYNPDPNVRVPFGDQGTEEMLFPTFGFLVDGGVDPKNTRPVKPTARSTPAFIVRDEINPETLKNPPPRPARAAPGRATSAAAGSTAANSAGGASIPRSR